jgi:hypothetical protein
MSTRPSAQVVGVPLSLLGEGIVDDALHVGDDDAHYGEHNRAACSDDLNEGVHEDSPCPPQYRTLGAGDSE